MKTFCLIIIFCFPINFQVFSQIDKSDYKYLKSIYTHQKSKTKYNINKDRIQTYDFLFQQLFWIYKHFFSSQDGNHCTFIPSCSEYMVISIQKKGPIAGFLSGIDRVMRCNGLHNDKYPLDTTTFHLIDPVE